MYFTKLTKCCEYFLNIKLENIVCLLYNFFVDYVTTLSVRI